MGDYMLVSDVVNTDVVFLTLEDSLARVRKIFTSTGVTKIPIFSEGMLVGGITELEVAKALATKRRGIEDVRVKEVMTDEIITVSPNDQIKNVVSNVIKYPLTIVMDKSNFIGVLTKKDILKRYLPAFTGTVSAGSICSKRIKTAKPSQSIFRAVKIMTENKVKHLPVIMEGELLGIVSAKDIALATFSLRPEKVIYDRRTREGMRRAVRIIPKTVSSIMRENVETAPGKADIKKIASRMIGREIGSVIIKDTRIRGIVTKTDLLNAIKEVVS